MLKSNDDLVKFKKQTNESVEKPFELPGTIQEYFESLSSTQISLAIGALKKLEERKNIPADLRGKTLFEFLGATDLE